MPHSLASPGWSPTPQESGPLESEAMVMGVLNQAFDVLVLRYGVQKARLLLTWWARARDALG